MTEPYQIPQPFDEDDFIDCCEKHDPNPYTLPINNGASVVLTAELKKLLMKTAFQGGNAERTRRLYAHHKQPAGWLNSHLRICGRLMLYYGSLLLMTMTYLIK